MLFKKIQTSKTIIIYNTHTKLIHETNKIIDLIKIS